MTLDEAIKVEETIVKDNERYVNLTRSNYAMPGTDKRKKEEKRVGECEEVIEEHRQLAEWLKELKAYREDTRFADLYERICIKRDDDREYFARTKDKTYITRIAEKEMFIYMMQDMMFDRYGVEEVNADDKGESVSDNIENN